MEHPLLEGAAEQVLRSAGADLYRAVSILALARHVLGADARIERVPGRALPAGAQATIGRVGNQVRLFVRHGLDGATERFALGHELAHHVLGHPKELRTQALEDDADYVAACLVVPRPALRVARLELGDDLVALADLFQASQTAIALRLGEAGALPAVVVVAPAAVRIRSLSEFAMPPEETLRRFARASALELKRLAGPGVRRARLTDDRRRVALLVDEDQVA